MMAPGFWHKQLGAVSVIHMITTCTLQTPSSLEILVDCQMLDKCFRNTVFLAVPFSGLFQCIKLLLGTAYPVEILLSISAENFRGAEE